METQTQTCENCDWRRLREGISFHDSQLEYYCFALETMPEPAAPNDCEHWRNDAADPNAPCREIGKLEDGSPDPCYDCAVIDDQGACVGCGDVKDYDHYVAPDADHDQRNDEAAAKWQAGLSDAMAGREIIDRLTSIAGNKGLSGEDREALNLAIGYVEEHGNEGAGVPE